MEYITGIHALNLEVENDNTPGDWHYSALDWTNPQIRNSNTSIFLDWGIAKVIRNPDFNGKMAANHIRACLDLIADGYFSVVGGMREYFISNDDYATLIFDKVWLLRSSSRWPEIDKFMGKEYLCKWLDFKEERLNGV